MPESPLDVQIRTLRQIAQASPAARVEATRLADALEAETIGNRRAAAQDAFQAIAPRYVGQQQAPAARTAAVAGLQEQLGAAFSVPTMQADRLRFAEAEGRAEGAEQGPVGGALAGLESGGTRLLGGIMQRSKDAGTTWYDPYLDVLPEAQAHVEQRVAASPVSATVGQAAPYLGAALAGAPGIALLTASEGVSSYGEGRQMGLDPDEASKRAAGQALLTAGGMLATPFSRAAAASNAAALGRGLLGREALEIGAGTLDALPQSLVMDVGGGAADVLQARSLGLAGGELEQVGKTRMATLPTAPELLLADVGMEALMSPFRVHGHRVATRQEQVRVASEQGALHDAATFIQGQRIADNQADLERQLIRGDRPQPEQILGGSMLEEGPPLPPGIVEGGMELTRPQVEGGVPSALARPVGPLEQAPARPDLPEIGQRMATQEASRLGVEERQRQELAHLEDEARQLEADLLGRNRVSDVAYFEQQIAAAEKAAEEAALRQRPQERTAALRQRMEAQRELAAVRKEAEAYQTRVRVNQERQKRLRELQAKALPTYEQTRQPGFLPEAARAAEPHAAAPEAALPAPIAPEAAPAPLEASRAPAVEAPAPPVAEPGRGAPSFLDRARAEAPKTPIEQRHPDSLVAVAGRSHPVGKGRIRTIVSAAARAIADRVRALHPPFQGNKGAIQEHSFEALTSRWTPEQRAQMTEIDERFGGGGGYGLSMIESGLLPNVKRLTVRELDPERAAKLQWVYDHGDQFDAIVARDRAQLDALFVRLYGQALEEGAREASMSAVIARLRDFLRTDEGRALPADTRMVLLHWAEAGRGYEDPWAHMRKMGESAVAQSAAAKRFRARGGTLEVKNEDSYGAPVSKGRHVLMLADPPYVHTKGYGESTVGLDTYGKTADLLHGAAAAENNIIYHDSAWMARPREDAMAQEAAKNADESFRILDDIGRAVPDMDVVASGTQEELFGARNPHDTPPAAPRDRSLPPAPTAGLPVGAGAAEGPAGPGRPGAAPRIDPRRLGKLPDAIHQRLVDDAAGVRGVRVERDAEGHTFLRFDGTETRVPVVYDTRPATERDARSWLESVLASGRQEAVGLVAAAVTAAARKLNLAPPGWALNPVKLTAETLRDNWNRALKGKDAERVIRQVMEDSPVMAVALRPGDLAGYEHAIGLTPAYQGRQIHEETWHLGWRVLPDKLKQEVIDHLPVHQREAARRSETSATEAATALLTRLWREHVARGAKPRSWLGRVIAAMREGLRKLLPFLAPKPDVVRDLAREFGEGRVFRRLDETEGGGEAEAQSVQLSARRKMAAETDEGRNTWEEVGAQAEAIIRDGPRLNAMIEKLDKPVGQRDLTQAEARALTMLAEEASLRMLGRAASAMRDPANTLAGLSQDVLDQAAWATLALQANRDAGQRLRNLANDPYAPNVSKIMAPFTEMSGGWKQRALKARSKAAKAQVTKEWEAWKNKILTKLAARGFDLRDPAMARDIDGMEADSVANLRFEIAQEIKRNRGWKERWADYSTGRLASELTMRNLLTLGSPIPQIPTSAYFGLRGQMRAAVESLNRAVDGLDAELLAGFGGRAQAAQHIGQSVIQGIRFGIESVLTGDSIAKGRLTGRTDYGADADGGEVMAGMEYVSVLQDVGDQLKDLTKVPGIGAALRVGMGPGLEAVRFIDDVTWTTTFEMTRRTLAAAKAKAQGGELLDYLQDQTIVDDAARHADRVTQRSRPDEKTIGGKAFKLVEGLRSPTFGGALAKGAGRFLYNPLMHLMPIFRTVALLTGEAGRVLGAPVRGAQGLKTLRLLRNADELQAQALEEGIAPAQLRRRLTDRYLDQMTDFVVGTLAYTLAATLGQSLLPAPEGEQTDPAEARAKELLRPTGDTPVGGLQRLSPVYETAMGAAATREALKKIFAEPSWRTSKEAAVEAMTATGRAILEKPLLSGAKALVSTPRDPVTGEKQSLPDYFAEQAHRQLLGFGSPYRHLARASEAQQTRSADPSKVTGLTEERVPAYGLTGETRSAPGGPAGIIKRGLFGNVPKAEGNERRVLALVEKLNAQLDEKLAREAPVGARPKPGEGGWWPGALNKDLPSEEDRRFVERMSVRQQEELNRITGERWWKMLSPQLDRIEKLGADNPKAALTMMQRMRSAAARAARYEVERAR